MTPDQHSTQPDPQIDRVLGVIVVILVVLALSSAYCLLTRGAPAAPVSVPAPVLL